MSGGSYDYAFRRVENFIETMDLHEMTTLRLQFQEHLKLVAKAMHHIEWYDSGDYGQREENAAIEKCLGRKP